mgnify:CR=1 FL=1
MDTGGVKSYGQICVGIRQKSITRGGLTASWLLFSGQGAKGQGRRYAACLALDALWHGCYLPSQQFLLHRLQVLHIHVLLVAPLGSCHMTQPGTYQHQCRISVRERADYPRPAPDLPVHPLDYIVGSDLRPMLRGKVTVGQSFLDASLNLLRCLCKNRRE